MNRSHDKATARSSAAAGDLTVGDGAMGTELGRAGSTAASTLHANRDEAERVLAVHRAYVAAGARLIQTNTFLAPHLLATEREAAARVEVIGLARAGIRLAVDAVNEVAPRDRPRVVMSLGPVAPDTPDDTSRAVYRALGTLAVAEPSLSALLLETFLDEAAILAAAVSLIEGCDSQPGRLRAADDDYDAASLPSLFLSMTPRDPEPGRCWSPAALARLSAQPFAGRIAAVGLNCGPGWDAATWIALADDLHARLPPPLPLLLKPSRPCGDTSPTVDSLGPLVAHLRAVARRRPVILLGCCGLGPAAIDGWCRQPAPPPLS